MGQLIQRELYYIFEALWRAAIVTLFWYGLDYFFGSVKPGIAYETAFFVGTTTWYVFQGEERDKQNGE